MLALERQLGLREAVSLGIGGTIGGGIFVLVGAAAAEAGPGMLLSFVLAFVCSLLLALPYAELACRFPSAGGGYAFGRAVFGPRWGYVLGWGYWGGYVFISGYVTLGFGGYLQAVTGVPVLLGAEALMVAVIVVNLLGIRISGRTQTAIVVVAIGAILAMAASGLVHVQAANFVPFLPFGLTGVLTAMLLAFLAFGGFDIVAAAGEEVKDPERTLPRAILLTLVLVLGVYLLLAYVALGVLPWRELGSSAAPLSNAASRFLGSGTGSALVSLAALLATAATANAVLVVTSRISFAMARDGLFPERLARVGGRGATPRAAVLVSGVLMALVPLGGSISLSTSIGGFLYALHFLFPPAALLILRRRDLGGERPAFRTPLAPVVLPLAMVAAVALMVASQLLGVVGGLLWLLLGAAVYATGRRR